MNKSRRIQGQCKFQNLWQIQELTPQAKLRTSLTRPCIRKKRFLAPFAWLLVFPLPFANRRSWPQFFGSALLASNPLG